VDIDGKTKNKLSIVELFGTPASGKTYIAEKLVNIMKGGADAVYAQSLSINRSRRAPRIPRKLLLVGFVALRHPILAWEYTRLVVISEQKNPKSFIRVLFNWLYVFSLVKCGGSKRKIVVMDQGFGQALWTMLYFSRRDRLPARCVIEKFNFAVRKLCIDSIVVGKVEAGEPAISERLRKGRVSESPLDRTEGATISFAQRITQQTEEILVEWSDGNDSVQLGHIDNSARHDSMGIRRQLLEFWRLGNS
jgi:hypothetical protein